MLAPISVCLIVRNESFQLDRCLRSVRPYVREIVVVDTSSEDDSPSIARSYADKFEVYTGCNHSNGLIRSFSDARQKSFDLATQPWVMWIDGDDEVIGAEKLVSLVGYYDEVRNGQPSMVTMPYEYGHDHHGNVQLVHDRERLVTPKSSFKWIGRVHEYLHSINGDVRQRTEEVYIVHKRDLSKKSFEHGRNLRMLKEQYAEEGDSDLRLLYYLGLEYGNNGDINNAISTLTKYIERSPWEDEKYLACLKIAQHYTNTSSYQNAIDWALKATLIHENWSEAYFAIAKCSYYLALNGHNSRRNWERCVYYARHGLSLPPTQTPLFVHPLERSYEIHKFLNVALIHLGRKEEAMESINTGLKVAPDDIHLLANKRTLERQEARHNFLVSLERLEKLDVISSDVKAFAEKVVVQNDIPMLSPISGSFLDIVVYVGNALEPWNPVTAAQNGIGGSETAVIEMSRRLASKGHRVRVFGECSRLEGTFDGVQYRHHSRFRDLSCDVLIVSRQPHAVDDELNVKSQIKLLWVHDIHCGTSLTHARTLRVDKFLTLSNWHREFFLSQYQYVHPSQVLVTRNGIDLTRFQKSLQRNAHRAVYSSSPDRGMQVVVSAWPKIREQIPDAELHVYYGFENWEKTADVHQLELIKHLKKLLTEHESIGVTFHGRVDQATLAEEYLKSGVWAYSTWFSETSCISAMEAHAAGLRMVTSPIAALNETVGERGVMIQGDWLSEEYESAFIDAVVSAMRNEDDSDRVKLQEYAATHFSWDTLADEWIEMFNQIISEVQQNMMPPYRGVV